MVATGPWRFCGPDRCADAPRGVPGDRLPWQGGCWSHGGEDRRARGRGTRRCGSSMRLDRWLTVVSILVALITAGIAWRQWRDAHNRRRKDARKQAQRELTEQHGALAKEHGDRELRAQLGRRDTYRAEYDEVRRVL